MIICSIVGILGVLGAITLYRTYALYEEEKEFNVLKGTIPDFGYDIKMLSVVVDDKKETNIPARGLYKTNVDCTNGTTGEWDYNAWNLTLENVSSNAKCNITFTSNLSEEEYNKYIEAGKALRRNTYRGKDITEYHNDGSLYEMISNGTFDDIYVGDYIVANNVTWLVADIDNYLYTGNTPLTKHHLTIIPADNLTSASMNTTDTTEGGYYNSQMKQSTLPSILSTYVEPVFNGHVLTYANILTNEVDENANNITSNLYKGASNNWSWYNSQIDLMSEVNVFGTIILSSNGLDIGIDNQQYAIFLLKPEFAYTNGNSKRLSYWLKSVSNSKSFVFADVGGCSDNHALSKSAQGVRPRFLIG